MNSIGKISKQNGRINRRQFLQIVAVTGVAGLTLKVGLDRLNELETIQESRLLMGTVVNLTVITSNANQGRLAVSACLDRMQGLEEVLSRFKRGSQLSQLNLNGRIKNANSALLELIEQSQSLGYLSGGAFDITIKPLVDLYAAYEQQGKGLPPKEEVERLRQRVDYHQIHLVGEEVSFAMPGMAITLDGIAKGYIVDQGISTLRQFGFENVLVEAGGDLSASGEKAPDAPWRIGIQSPRKAMGQILTRLQVADQAIATSGDYMHTFTADFTEHHILDPRTGYSSPELASATVIAPTCALADGLATAMMVLGVDSGFALLESLENCQATLVKKDGEIVTSDNLRLG